MSKKVRKEFVLYDSREEFEYEAYVEFCEINGIEPDVEGSDDYWDWVCQTRNDYYDDMMTNLSWTKIDYPLMIVGDLGLWDGRHSIVPVPIVSEGYGRKFRASDYVGYDVPSMKAAIKKCCEGRGTLDVDVHYEDGLIKVCAHHHDGCNVFYIRKLSKKGIKGMQAAANKHEDCNPKEWWFCKIKRDEIDF